MQNRSYNKAVEVLKQGPTSEAWGILWKWVYKEAGYILIFIFMTMFPQIPLLQERKARTRAKSVEALLVKPSVEVKR